MHLKLTFEFKENKWTENNGGLIGNDCGFLTVAFAVDEGISFSDCVDLCETFESCSHFEYVGSSCYLRRGPIRKSFAIIPFTGWKCGIPAKVCQLGGC